MMRTLKNQSVCASSSDSAKIDQSKRRASSCAKKPDHSRSPSIDLLEPRMLARIIDHEPNMPQAKSRQTEVKKSASFAKESNADSVGTVSEEDDRDERQIDVKASEERRSSEETSSPSEHTQDDQSLTSCTTSKSTTTDHLWKRLDIKLKELEPVEHLGKGYYSEVSLVRRRRRVPSEASTRSPSPSSDNNVVASTEMVEERFALKCVQRSHMSDQCLANEVRVMHQLAPHPFHTRILNAYRSSTRVFLLMEHVPLKSLASHIERGVGLKDTRLPKYYAANLLLALKYMHERNICHRDIKCANILVGADLRLKVCDYGFAKILRKGEFTLSLAGTCAYLSPEQLLRYDYDHSVDLWAFAICVYEMLFGSLPFNIPQYHGDSNVSTNDEDFEQCFQIGAAAILRGVRFPSTHELDPACSPEAKDFLSSMLDYFWDKRLGANLDYSSIMRHPWFDGMDWVGLETGRFLPLRS